MSIENRSSSFEQAKVAPFDQQLSTVMQKALLDLDMVMGRHVDLKHGAAANAASLIREKFAQVGAEAKKLGENLSEHDQKDLMKRLEIALHALSARAELALVVSGKKDKKEESLAAKVDTPEDAEKLLRLVGMIKNFSVGEILAGDRSAEALGEPANAVLRKLAQDEVLDETDFDFLATQIVHLQGNEVQKNPLNPKNTAIILLTQLNAKDRMEVLKRVVDQNPKMVVAMVIADYISVAQAEELLKNHPQDLAQLHRPDTLQARDQVVAAANRRTNNVRIFKSNQNPAAQLLSFIGLGSTALWLNGIATTAVNVAVNVGKGPGSLENYLAAATSPGTWLGIAQIGVASELNNGMGGIFKKPSEWATTWMRANRAEGGLENRLRVLKDTLRALFDHPELARSYADQSEQIHEAYGVWKKKPNSEKTAGEFEKALVESGVVLKGSAQKTAEQFLKWAVMLENNHGLETATAQKDFIRDNFIRQGLTA